MIYFKRLIILLFVSTACQSLGHLTIEGSINNSLKEVSAAEMNENSDLIWVIEDAGNNNNLIALNIKGKIVRNISITNAKNEDWEDLTIDKHGNVYIGDFGNNDKKRALFTIYKIKQEDLEKDSAIAEVIEFTLPKEQHIKDFEAFFIYDSAFYILSKETKKFILLKVRNEIGKQEAVVRSHFNLDGKNNKITSADVSDDGKTLVLLNHDKLWKITNFIGDDFFSGDIKLKSFKNNTQKEGVCFQSNKKVIITDERNGHEGGNIYSFDL